LLAQGLEGDEFFREVFADPMQSDTTVPVPTVAAFDCGANSADQGTVKNRPGPCLWIGWDRARRLTTNIGVWQENGLGRLDQMPS
jgi:hypothetical protein